MTDVVRVSESGLFRSKVMDKQQRRMPLDSVRRLKLSDVFNSVFIQMGLTYRLRRESMESQAAHVVSNVSITFL